MSAALDLLRAAARDPHTLVRDWKAATGGQVVGFVGDVPVEPILAAGMLPVQVVARPDADGSAADALAGSGADPAVRTIAAQLLDGGYDYLDQLLIASSPAIYGALYNFFIEARRIDPDFAGPRPILHDFLYGPSAALPAFDRRSVELLVEQLGVSADLLPAAITAENGLREQLDRFAALRRDRRISGTDALAVIAALRTAPVPAVREAFAQLLDDLADAPALPGVPMVVSGSDVDSPVSYAALESAGALVVADDHDRGGRIGEGRVAVDGDPITALADFHRTRRNGPIAADIRQRSAYLTDLVERSGARAVIFHILAIDHPSTWDYPRLRDALDDKSIAHVELGALRYRDPISPETQALVAGFLKGLPA